VIGEPTSFEIINTHKGLVHSEIVIKGIGGHSSRPDLGVNAITPIGKVIQVIDEMNADYEKNIDPTLLKLFPDFPRNYIHMAMINAGLAGNMIPEEARLTITYRSFPGTDGLQVLNELKQRISTLGIENLVFENTMQVPASPLAEDKEIISVLKAITGTEETRSVSFATDAGYFSQLGIDCFVCGPGEIAMAHKPNEYMPVADYLRGVVFVKELLLKTVF
jgi:acetylornithine deacetylase